MDDDYDAELKAALKRIKRAKREKKAKQQIDSHREKGQGLVVIGSALIVFCGIGLFFDADFLVGVLLGVAMLMLAACGWLLEDSCTY